MTTTDININSAAYRCDARPAPALKCDTEGCGNPARYRWHAIEGATVTTYTLCAECRAKKEVQ